MTAIKHVVVLMLENRSFDHKLGFLMRDNPEIAGLTGDEQNLNDPGSPLPVVNPVTDHANYEGDLDADPPHELADVAIQLYGHGGMPDYGQTPDNSGFVLAYGIHQPPHGGGYAMRCFAPGRLPAFHALAREFAVCDHWFASVPGPTWPNRFFVHCASAGGFVDGNLRVYGMRTIFDSLHEAGQSVAVYFHDFAQALILQRLQVDVFKGFFHEFSTFLDDARAGTLPSYSFIEPRYYDGAEKANDEHPPHDMRLGDQLVARVYEAVRASPAWESTLLLVLSDEHGGLYDHVPPPRATPPGDGVSADPPFGFDRLGVRVPALVISPLVPRGTVDHCVYDHASVPATLRKLFGLAAPLTERDAQATTFDGILSLSTARTDTPLRLPTEYPPLPGADPNATDLPGDSPDDPPALVVAPPAPAAPLSALQRKLLAVAAALSVDESPEEAAEDRGRVAAIDDERAASAYVAERMRRHLAKR